MHRCTTHAHRLQASIRAAPRPYTWTWASPCGLQLQTLRASTCNALPRKQSPGNAFTGNSKRRQPGPKTSGGSRGPPVVKPSTSSSDPKDTQQPVNDLDSVLSRVFGHQKASTSGRPVSEGHANTMPSKSHQAPKSNPAAMRESGHGQATAAASSSSSSSKQSRQKSAGPDIEDDEDWDNEDLFLDDDDMDQVFDELAREIRDDKADEDEDEPAVPSRPGSSNSSGFKGFGTPPPTGAQAEKSHQFKIFLYGTEEAATLQAIRQAGWASQISLTTDIRQAHAVVTAKVNKSGKHVKLLQGEKTAANAGIPFVVVGRHMTKDNLKASLQQPLTEFKQQKQ